MMRITHTFLPVVLAAALSAARAQTTHPLTGRQILPAAPAERTANPDTEINEDAAIAIQAMGVDAGTYVADVGSSTEHYTARLAQHVGETGKVYAVEIRPGMLDRVRKMIVARGIYNVKIVRGSDQDPKLPAGKMDVVLLANVYSKLPHPQEMLRKILESLTTNGRLMLVEHREENASASAEAPITLQQMKTELEAEGFKFQKVVGMPRHHLVVFVKPAVK